MVCCANLNTIYCQTNHFLKIASENQHFKNNNFLFFYRDLEALNALDGEEAELAFLSQLLDLGLSNEIPDAPKVLPNNVVDVLENSGNFTTFLKLIKGLNMTKTLQELPQVTIFAPSDEVFIKMMMYSASAKDLKRHLILVKLPSENIVNGPAFTMSGEVVNLVKTSQGEIQIQYESKSINVVQADIQASNGIIHVIDQYIV